MATITVALKDGLKIGEETHLEAELREPTTGELLEAMEESERVVITPEGYKLVSSPTRTGVEILRRQIVRVGSYSGPLTLNEIKKLSSFDMTKLQVAAQGLETAALEVSADRGRMDQAPE